MQTSRGASVVLADGEQTRPNRSEIHCLHLTNLAVRVGFEPPEPAKVQRFSRPPDSTTLAPHRILILPGFHHLRTLSPRVFRARQAVSPIWHHFLQSTQPPASLLRGSYGRSASSQILTNGRAVP